MKKAALSLISGLALVFLASTLLKTERRSLQNETSKTAIDLQTATIAPTGTKPSLEVAPKLTYATSAQPSLSPSISFKSDSRGEIRHSKIEKWQDAELLESRVTPSHRKGFSRNIEIIKHPDLAHPIRIETLVSDSDGNVVVLQEAAAQHIIFQVREGIQEEDLGELLKEFDLKFGERISDYGLYTALTSKATIDATPEAISLLNDIIASHFVEYATYDFLRHPTVLPNDPKLGDNAMWGLDNQGLEEGSVADADIDAPEGWDVRTDASNVIVAVTDTGIRSTHEDLVENMWTNLDEIPDNGIDDDENGYIDDIHGVDTILAAEGALAGNPVDEDGHGTHVAGTIGASGDNGLGISGVAWKVKLMAVKSLGPVGGFDSDLIEGIDYAVANGAHIINASWGSPSYTQAVYDAIKRAEEKGIPFIAAAGNEGMRLGTDNFSSYPADYDLPNVLSIANHTNQDALDGSSNYSREAVDIAAPGTNILSAGIESDTDYVALSGTSMAAPHVSGILALVKAEYPNDDYIQLIERLLQSGETPLAGSYEVRTNSRVNLAGALAERSLRPSSPYDARINTVGGKAIVSWKHAWNEDFDGFRIMRSTSGQGFQVVGSVSPTSLRFEDQPANPNQSYQYKVTAFNASGESLPSPTLTLTELPGFDSEFLSGSLLELFYYDFGSFGVSIDSEGGLLAVSAHQDWDKAPEAGAVIIYDRFNNGQWIQRQKLIASDGSAYHHFGNALSLDGDTLAIGAHHHDGAAIDTGAVYIFQRNNEGVWQETQKITASDATLYDRFGYAIALNGDTLAVTARDDTENGVASGSVYVYTRGMDGVWGNETKIIPADGAIRQYFGWSLSLDGDRLAIGARGDATNGRYSGAAYLYTRPAGSNSWAQELKLTPANGSKYDFFGQAVALKGAQLLVGAPNHDANAIINAGATFAYIWLQGSGWTQQQILSASDATPHYHFGYSLDISNGRALVGSNDLAFWHGGSYLYTRDTNLNWNGEPEKFALPLFDFEGEPAGYSVPGLGFSLSLDDGFVVMGSAFEDSIFTSVE